MYIYPLGEKESIMKNNQSNLFKICFAFALVFLLSFTSLSAEENLYYSEEVPDTMEPGSEIYYVEDNKFKIIKGNISEKGLDGEKKPLENVYGVVYGKPHKGIKGITVTYADDGLINKIIYDAEDQEKAILENTETYVGTGLKDNANTASTWLGDEVCDSYSMKSKWGAYPNTLYNCTMVVYPTRLVSNILANPIYITDIVGLGRATTFSDVIGQANIVLKKGDVATSLAYDNVPVGTLVNVSTKTNTGVLKRVIMRKNDAGGMPNAVLDIWKTGVEYWGYTWNSSFSMPNRVTIRHK